MKINLNEHWTFKRRGEQESLPATVPGCVHTDLLHHGKIPDPHFQDNETQLMWIGHSAWDYSNTFEMEESIFEYDRILLRCEGLDTLATIKLNGTLLGQTHNQFRTWEFDIKPSLKSGINTLEVLFDSPFPLIQEEQEKRYLHQTGLGHHRVDGGNRVRKSQCNFGWDWGPICVTAGIWRPLEIFAFNDARLADVHILQEHLKENVVLRVQVTAEVLQAGELKTEVVVFLDDHRICLEEAEISEGSAELTVPIPSPQLWWPNGLGAQPLYQIRVALLKETETLDTQTQKIGLRTLVLETIKDEWGESFQFAVNGKAFFAKGANWIPADTFVTRISHDHYRSLVKETAAANMNMLRVWGGGIYEDDLFYELCDQYGICIWQDFMFACSAYPAFDEAFVQNVKNEAEDNIKRLRHHPSLTLWCGNNELEHLSEMFLGDEEGKMTWEEYRYLFDDVLSALVHQFDPQGNYWPSSPHSPVGDRLDHNNPACGDAHLWDVWHGLKPFEWYRTCEHRFNSEFGFQSFPEPETVATYTLPEDRNITSFIMEHHQRSPIGNSAIINYMLSWFQMPKNFEMTLWLSQIQQGMAMKYAVEHWRRSMPRGMGTLYWQLNDCWQGPSWSSIDYFGRWKALQYIARDFNAPLLISAVENLEEQTAEIHVTNDRLQVSQGTITSSWFDTRGKLLQSETVNYHINPQESRQVTQVRFEEKIDPRHLLLRLELLENEKIVSSNVAFFKRPKHLTLNDPKLEARVEEQQDGSYIVTIRAKHPALWVWPELSGVEAKYSNRFFHVFPDQPATLRISPTQSLNLSQFQQSLQLNSLTDTY